MLPCPKAELLVFLFPGGSAMSRVRLALACICDTLTMAPWYREPQVALRPKLSAVRSRETESDT